MRVALIQTKPRKGDIATNLRELAATFGELAHDGVAYDLLVLPEAALTGYFLEGGVYALAMPAEAMAERIAQTWRGAHDGVAFRPVDVAIGFYENSEGTYYNAALYVRIEADRHAIVHVHRKLFLPTYGVFDEARFVSRGRRIDAFETSAGRAAMLICEDAWHAIVPTIAAVKGARILIVPSASPGRGFVGPELESVSYWRNVLRSYAVEHGVFVLYAGLAGFEGGKGMSGSSFALDPFGDTIGALPALGAGILKFDLDPSDVELARARLPLLGNLSSVLPDLLEGGAFAGCALEAAS